MNAKNIGEILDALAARLSVPAGHLWAVLVAQARVEFWENVVAVVVFGIPAAICIRVFFKELKKGNEFSEAVVATVAVIGSLCCLATVVALAELVGKIGYIANPEYYALHEVLSVLK